MPKIRGYDFRQSKGIIGEIEFENNTYYFKESHSSKSGTYKVGIFDKYGNRLKNITADRATINKMKNNLGLGAINFQTEEGFKNFFDKIYGREFDPQLFKEQFIDKFKERYEWTDNIAFTYTKDGEQKFGKIKAGRSGYIAYLLSLAPTWSLENIYTSQRKYFSALWHYGDFDEALSGSLDLSTQNQNRANISKSMDAIEAEVKTTLKGQGIKFMSYTEFKKNVNRKD